MNTEINSILAREGYSSDDTIALVSPVAIVGIKGSWRGTPYGAQPRGRLHFVKIADLDFGDQGIYHHARHPALGRVQVRPAAQRADELTREFPQCETYKPWAESWANARAGRSKTYAAAQA